MVNTKCEKQVIYIFMCTYVCICLCVTILIKVKETMKLSGIWVKHDSAI